jgi:hypothetical protein
LIVTKRGARARGLFAIFLTSLLSACSTSSGTPDSAVVSARAVWVTAWGQAMNNSKQSASNPASSEQTFRTIVKPTVGSRGTARIHLSNLYGTAPVTIGSMHVGIAGNAASVASGDVPVSFGGKPSITLAAGATAYSDPVALAFSYGAKLAVTTYVSGSWSSLPVHQNASIVTEYETPAGAGNRTADLAGTTFTQSTSTVFLIDRLDLYGNYTGTVAIAGSSTSGGFGSDINGFDDMVDAAADDLHKAGRDDLALANMAVIPDSLLAKNDLNGDLSVLERLQSDFLSLPTLRTIVQNTADIDLKALNCGPATDVIAGDQQLIAAAHAANVRVLLAVVAPSTFCNAQNPSGFGTRFPAGSGQDGQRQLLNAWIVSTTPTMVSGILEQPPGADGIVDLSTPITDPTNTGYMLPAYDTGDDAHVNAAGQAIQGAAIANAAL